MPDLNQTLARIRRFRDERDWAQFHNGKDLALALSIEAAELNELFLWKRADEADPEQVEHELADVFVYALLLLDQYGLDLDAIVADKLALNARKYPVDSSKGSAEKRTERSP